jgi:hypothetical protein
VICAEKKWFLVLNQQAVLSVSHRLFEKGKKVNFIILIKRSVPIPQDFEKEQ